MTLLYSEGFRHHPLPSGRSHCGPPVSDSVTLMLTASYEWDNPILKPNKSKQTKTLTLLSERWKPSEQNTAYQPTAHPWQPQYGQQAPTRPANPGSCSLDSLIVLLSFPNHTHPLRPRSNCTSSGKPCLASQTFIDLPLPRNLLSKYWLHHNCCI